MKTSKHFDFKLPLTATRYGRVECIGNLLVSGVAYKKSGEISYDIDEVHFIDVNDRSTKVEMEVAAWLAGGELPDDIHVATQSHCEGLFEAECTATDMKQDYPPMMDVFKELGTYFNPNHKPNAA